VADPPFALELDGLRVARRGWQLGVDRLQLARGAAAGIVAPSGAGKSTLLLGMLGLLDDVRIDGFVRVAGADLAASPPAERRKLLRARVACVLQDARAALDPLVRLGDQLALLGGCTPAAGAAAAADLGLDAALLARPPHRVSGGQAQRVLLAAALVRAPALLIADEPTASLDPRSVGGFLAALALFRARTGAALLVATHDRELIERIGATPYTITDGRIAAGLPPPVDWPARERASGVGELLLEAQRLGFAYAGEPILVGLDLTLRRGEILVVTGPSGAGKTTLARLLAGQLAPTTGTLRRPPRRTAVQLLFQEAYASLTPGRSIASLIAETAAPGFELGAAAAALGFPPALLDRTAAQLSGGERRRAALLRAMSVMPDVLVLDEPTASLDPANASAVVATLLRLMRGHAIGVVLITHDRSLAAAVADRQLELGGG
jgi:ABC-type glutathione transport system ATPase component